MLAVWVLRGVWLVLPIAAWNALADSLSGRSRAVELVAGLMLLTAWFVTLVALLAPSTISLTVLRIVAPAAPVGIAVVLLSGDAVALSGALALGPAAIAAATSLLPAVGDVMVNGSAYGPERRMALRPPAALLMGTLPLTWAAVTLGVAAGPLLLAGGNWFLGLAVMLVGWAAAYFGWKSLHQLSRRWIVFVPAGFVIHDYMAMAESILMRRKDIAALGPAPADSLGATDISGGALGLALQVSVAEPFPIALRSKRQVVTGETSSIVFTPSLPGQLLHEARVRGIKIA